MNYEMKQKYSGSTGIKKAIARMQTLRADRIAAYQSIDNDSLRIEQLNAQPQNERTGAFIKFHQDQTAKANRKLKRIAAEINTLLEIWPADIYEPRWERGAL